MATTPRRWKPDRPGSFQTPPGVTAVRDSTGRLWTRNRVGTRWTSGAPHICWRTLVTDHGPITEQPAPAA